MPDLGKSFFQGEKDLNLKEIASLETTNISDGVTTVLLKHGWNANQLGSGVVLELSPDNLHIARANFFLRGPLGDDGITVQAAKCWPTADDDIVLHFKFPAGEKFSFSSGGVFSDYLDSNEFTHSFHSVDEEGNQTDVEESEWRWRDRPLQPTCRRLPNKGVETEERDSDQDQRAPVPDVQQ